MSTKTRIGWTDATWNPVVGCSQISPGCAHCYAKALHDKRHKAFLGGKLQNVRQYAQPFEKVQLFPDRLTQPLKWRTPRRVFVNSLSDVFHEDVPLEFIAAIWATMILTPRHTFQVLTKRPERACEVLSHPSFYVEVLRAADRFRGERRELCEIGISNPSHFPPRNVWLGVSVENQRWVERVEWLIRTPAAVRFISAEPLLGPIDLDGIWGYPGSAEDDQLRAWPISWVIIGGESGPKRREMHLEWMESLVAQCDAADVPVFVKQDSALRDGQQGRIPDELWERKEFPLFFYYSPSELPQR